MLALVPGLAGVANEPDDAAAPEAALQYVKRLAARSSGIRSLHVRFRQEKRLRILRRPRVSEGEIWYADGRLSMQAGSQGAVESHLLLREGELRILYPQLKRLETLRVGSTGGRRDPRMAIPFLAGDWQAAEKDYEVSLRREEERVVLVLVPRDSTSPVKTLRMVLVGDRLREYFQEEKSGNNVRMEILSWEENQPIPVERFRLDVPAGTKTVPLR